MGRINSVVEDARIPPEDIGSEWPPIAYVMVVSNDNASAPDPNVPVV